MALTGCLNDDSFGPVVQGCRGGFDFTQKFERIIFWIVPAAIFIPLAIIRVIQLVTKPRLVRALPLQLLKIVSLIKVFASLASLRGRVGTHSHQPKGSIAVHAALELSLLVYACVTDAVDVPALSIAGLSIGLVAQLTMIAVSHLEHARCRQPSLLLNVYNLLTLLFDIAQARTLWLVATNGNKALFARLFTASVAVKLSTLCLEAFEKTKWVIVDGVEHSPEESSGPFSLVIYFWLKRLFLRGFRKTLALQDLYPLDRALSADVTSPHLLENLRHQRQKGRKHALFKALMMSYPSRFLFPILPRAALVGFRYAQSFLIQALLRNLERPESSSRSNDGYGLIGACALIYAGMVASTAFYGYLNSRAAYLSRACLCASIYDGTTRLELSRADDAAALTLMSTDVAHIETGLLQMHQLWGASVEVALGSWLLYTKLGFAFFVPLGLITLCTGLLYWVMSYIGPRQLAWMEKIQTRVAITAQACADMKNFKMLGIAGRVANMVQTKRAEEIHAGNQFRKLMLASVVLSYTPLSLSSVFAFAATVRTFDVSRLFVSLSFILLTSSPLLTLFQALPVFLAALASFKRVDAYLAQPPRKDFRLFSRVDRNSGREDEQDSHLTTRSSFDTDLQPEKSNSTMRLTRPAFSAVNASFGWEEGKMILKDLDFIIPRGKVTMIIGPTASGKSTLCHAMLGEIPFAAGDLTVGLADSAMGYCAQATFLSSGTVKENIIGFNPFSQRKYDITIGATMLEGDIAQLSSGHDTDVGSNGIKLSGGQKQRVALARTLYLGAEISLFDDALSGLDATTETRVFEKVLGPTGLVRERGGTAVYFTSSSRHLSLADHVILLGQNGNIVRQGPPEILSETNISETNISKEDRCLITVSTASANSKYSETTETGNASNEGASDKTSYPNAEDDDSSGTILGSDARQTGDLTIYLYYLRSTGVLVSVCMVLFSSLSGFCSNFSTVWMSYWAQNTFDKPTSFYLGIYGMLRGLELIGIFGAAALLLITVVTSSGTSLHLRAITTVANAPLRLFTNTDTGTVTNLFSQDMTIIDGELPVALLNAFLVLFELLGNCFVIAVASPYLLVSYPVLAGILYLLQMFYLRTSRQLRLLDLESKSPLYSHFLDTIRGLTTIRTHATEQHNLAFYNKILNDSQRPAYLLAMIQQWLSTILLALVGLIATIITILAVQLRTNSGFTGSSFVTLMTLSSAISELMQSYTLVETSIGAVSRLRAFSRKVKPEDELDEDIDLPQHWPAQGQIRLAGVSASYETTGATDEKAAGALALSNISLSIESGEKIGICGRTGSGKSSLMLLLLRLLEPLPSSSYTLEVDAIALNRVNRTELRQRVITIAQEPVFLPGERTIKDNLDYLGEATDEDCVSVVVAAQLADFVNESGGLHATISTDTLSSGQKKLFSCARAMLRRRTRHHKTGGSTGGILLVDELNSGLDDDTDHRVQDIIRQEFEGYTVIIIAHQLDMVVNLCNRVLVLDKGEVVEADDPKILLASTQSHFSRLYHGEGGEREI